MRCVLRPNRIVKSAWKPVVAQAKQREDHLFQWVMRLAKTKHMNVVAVELANKTVRMVFAMLQDGCECDPNMTVC
jgi:hypothetical protein